MATKIIKRGNDDINVDDIKRNAYDQLNLELSSTNLSKDDLNLIRTKLDKLIKGLYEDNVTYDVDNKIFNNTLGLTDNDIMSGYAAGVLGHAIRKTDTYIAPVEETSVSNKIDWKGPSSIQEALISRIFGDGDVNLDYFTNLDYNPETKQIESNKKRSEKIIEELKYLRDNTESEFNNYENYTGFDEAIKLLEDGVTKNEYFELSKLLGIQNMDDWFGNIYTPVVPETVKPAAPETVKPAAPETVKPDQKNVAFTPRSLVDRNTQGKINNYGNYFTTELRKKIHSLPYEDLRNLTLYSVNADPATTQLYHMKLFQTPNQLNLIAKYSNVFIIKTLLDEIKSRPESKPYIYQDNKRMYIKGSKNSSRGTGLVYDISDLNNPCIKEFTISEIPYLNKTLSNKKGGILKYGGGGDFEKLSNFVIKDDHDWAEDKFETDFESLVNPYDWKEPWKTTELSKTDPNKYLPISDIKKEWFTDLYKNDTYYSQINSLIVDATGKFTEFGKKLAMATDKFRPKSLRIFDDKGNLKSNSNNWFGLGSPENYFLYLRKDNKGGGGHNVPKEVLYRQYYFDDNNNKVYVNREAPINDYGYTYANDGKYEESVVDENTPWRVFRDRQIILNKDTTAGNGTTTDTETGAKTDIKTGDKLTGKDMPIPFANVEVPKMQKWRDIGSLGRVALYASNVNSTNKSIKAIEKTLKAPLHDTYEVHVPITGNFAAKQYKAQLAASTMFQAKEHPVSADVNLASAQMLQALRLAKNLEAEGFLVNDNALRERMDQAMKVNWENTARRTENNNQNLDRINVVNREKGLLEASRIKANQTSINNFANELISRWETRYNEDKQKHQTFMENVAQQNATYALSEYQRKIKEDIEGMKAKDPNGYLSDPHYIYLKSMLVVAQNRAKDWLYEETAPLYGAKYKPRWGKQNNIDFFNTNP